MAGIRHTVSNFIQKLGAPRTARYPSVQDIISQALDEREQLEDQASDRSVPAGLKSSSEVLGVSEFDEYGRWGKYYIPLEWTKFHSLTMGVTGAGKSHLLSMAFSSVLDTLKHHPERRVVVFDLKGDIRSILAGHGVPYVVLSVDHQEGYAPDIAKDFNGYTELNQLGHQIIPDAKTSDPFWQNAARAVFSGVAKSFFHTQGTNFKLHDFFCLLQEDLPTVLRVLNQFPDNHDVVKYILSEHTEKTSFSVMSNLSSEIKKISHAGGHSQNVNQHLSLREFLFNETQPAQVLVITQREVTREVTNPLVGILFDRIVDLLLDSPEHKDVYGDDLAPWLFLFADELASLPKLLKLRKFVSATRSKGGAGFFATQGIGGLRSLYGNEEAAEIVGNCNFKTFCAPPLDGITAQWMSSIFGENQYSEFVPTGVSIDPKTSRINASATLNRYKQDEFSSGDFTSLQVASKRWGVGAIFSSPFTGSFKRVVEPELIENYKQRRFPVPELTRLPAKMEFVRRWSEEERNRFLGTVPPPLAAESRKVEPGIDPVFTSLGVELLASLLEADPSEPIGAVLKRCEAIMQKVMDAVFQGMSQEDIQKIVDQLKSEEG
ncbi:MAG: type IV secretion system DNA-binding domain-containing protein [Plectolyngbya sp. WJT66-NPBG17]|jgi:hypothetical protein|nr:type IV secretion system DNA-binding domain-containing protein [Plectolyngbya sp. WJT66-NPBG17]